MQPFRVIDGHSLFTFSEKQAVPYSSLQSFIITSN